jgi:hypothetical protein
MVGFETLPTAQTMNVAGRFRYATLPGIADFYRWEVVQSIGAGLKARALRSRAAR